MKTPDLLAVGSAVIAFISGVYATRRANPGRRALLVTSAFLVMTAVFAIWSTVATANDRAHEAAEREAAARLHDKQEEADRQERRRVEQRIVEGLRAQLDTAVSLRRALSRSVVSVQRANDRILAAAQRTVRVVNARADSTVQALDEAASRVDEITVVSLDADLPFAAPQFRSYGDSIRAWYGSMPKISLPRWATPVVAVGGRAEPLALPAMFELDIQRSNGAPCPSGPSMHHPDPVTFGEMAGLIAVVPESTYWGYDGTNDVSLHARVQQSLLKTPIRASLRAIEAACVSVRLMSEQQDRLGRVIRAIPGEDPRTALQVRRVAFRARAREYEADDFVAAPDGWFVGRVRPSPWR